MQSSNGDLERWLPEIGGEKPSGSTRRGWTGGRVLLTLAAVFALFILVSISKGFYGECGTIWLMDQIVEFVINHSRYLRFSIRNQ